MSEIRVGFEAVEGAADALGAEAASMEGLISEADAQVKALQDAWEGEAAEQYQLLQTEWTKAQEEMKVVLKGLGATTAQAASVYRDTEKAVGQMFS